VKVMIITPTSVPGVIGPSVTALELSKHIADECIEVHLIANNFTQSERKVKLSDSLYVYTPTNHKSNLFAMIKRIPLIIKLVHGEGIDIIHALEPYTFDDAGKIGSYLTKTPYIVDMGSEPIEPHMMAYRAFIIDKKANPGWERKISHALIKFGLGKFWFKSITRNADRIIVVSETLKIWFEKEYDIPAEKMNILPLGANVINGNQNTAINIRDKYNIYSSPLLVCASELALWHGVEVLIRAIPYLKKEFPDVKVIITGGHHSDSESVMRHRQLGTMAKDLGVQNSVIFTGWVPREELIAILKEADIGVDPRIPSPKKILGFSPLKDFEYMACGLPIVASDTPETREIFKNGEMGILTPPNDPIGLSEVLIGLLSDKQKAYQMGLNAKKAFERRYTWKKRAKDLIKIYEDISQA
jgi:glycosyltransferase involved in cell wall biosynthesis